jgi:hypothetical protein
MTPWGVAVTEMCSSLELTLVADGSGFLGLGSYGRVVKCLTKEGEAVALKIVQGKESQAGSPLLEF